jgi:hypothetical protein
LTLDLESLNLTPETVYMLRILEVGSISLNVGGNRSIGAITGAWKTKWPLSIHAGISKPWEKLLSVDVPGLFVGIELRF